MNNHEMRASEPSAEFLKQIHTEDLEELHAAALIAELEEGLPSVVRRHEELSALSDWIVSYGDLRSTDEEEVLEKEQIVENIVASFFLSLSKQAEALAEDYEDKALAEKV